MALTGSPWRAVSLPALLGTVTLHIGVVTALLAAVPMDSTTPSPRTLMGGAQGALVAQNVSPMTIIFFDPPRSANRGFQQPTAVTLTPIQLSVEAGDPDPISIAPPAEPTDGADQVASARDPSDAAAQQAKLFGRYVGQITARIERAWVKPRDSIDGGTFACRIVITQDALGKVNEIEVSVCSENARWQKSLVQAVESAAPLPAPPDPKVFTSTLTLAFTANTFSPRAPEIGFESEARGSVASGDSHVQR